MNRHAHWHLGCRMPITGDGRGTVTDDPPPIGDAGIALSKKQTSLSVELTFLSFERTPITMLSAFSFFNLLLAW